MNTLDVEKASEERNKDSTALLKQSKTKQALKKIRLVFLLGQAIDSVINLLFAMLIIGAISNTNTTFLAATPNSVKCTLVSIVNEAKQIKDIDEWRASYGYDENVNAKHLPGCNAYLVSDKRDMCPYVPIEQDTDQVTNITTNYYNGEAATPITFDVTFSGFEHITLYYTNSTSYGRDILVGISWWNDYYEEKFLTTKENYDETISSYTINSGYNSGYFRSYGPLTQVTTVQQACSSCCKPGHAIIGFSGQFGYSSPSDTPHTFSWGVNPATCVNNCTATTYHIKNATYYGILGSLGNATFFPSNEDPCNKMSGVAAINYLDFKITQCYDPQDQNSNLRTPYGQYPNAYLYHDIYNSSVTHVPVEMGCSDDPYHEQNMIDPQLDRRRSSTSMFLVLCWLMSLFFVVISTRIAFEKLVSDDDTSELEAYMEKTLLGVTLWKCCCCCCCCCYGDAGYRGYIALIVDMLQYAVAFPIGILAPYNSRDSDFACFSIWDGMLDDDTSRGMGITWLVCVGCLFVYMTMSNILKMAECITDDKCCKCIKGTYEFMFIGMFIGTLVVLVGISIFDKAAEIKNIASVIMTGINFPSLSSVLKSIHIDGIEINNAVKYFLGYQITRIFGFVLMILQRLLDYSGRCVSKFEY